MRIRRILLVVLAAAALAAGVSTRAWAIASNAGTSGAQFLKLGAGSRAGAMGEAYAAMADDVYALYYNPAALTRLTRTQLAAAHTQHFQGIDYEFAGFVYPFGREEGGSRHALGIAIYNLSVSGLERRIDDTSSPVGTFDAGDYAYNVSYARRVNPRLSAGVTGKLIDQKIDVYSAKAVALDLGVLYKPWPKAKKPYSFALVLKNFGTRPDFAGHSDPLPLGITAGFATEPLPNKLKLELDLTKYRDTDVFGTLGAEYFHPFTHDIGGFLRAGASSHRKDNEGFNEMTLGAGINFRRARFDFAWVPFGALGNTFRYSLLVRF